MTTTPLPPSEGWELDYDKLIADAFANHKYRQGTRECVAFKNGAHWAMHNYATQARADLEAENANLRLELQSARDINLAVVNRQQAEIEALRKKLAQARKAEPISVSCRCFDEVSKRLCADKNRCFQAVAAGAAPQPAEAVPPGYVLAPVNPTPEIMRALGNKWDGANAATWQRVIAAIAQQKGPTR